MTAVNNSSTSFLHFFKIFERRLWRSSVLVKLQTLTYKFILKNKSRYMYFGTADFSFLLFHFAYYNYILCIPHFCRRGAGWGQGVWESKQILKKGKLDRTSTFRGGCWDRGAWFFSGRFQLSQKNKLKSEICNDKNIFLCHK